MASEFFTILTAAGKAKIASALAEQKQIRLQTMVVGDGNGKYIEPTESQTKVVHEVWRGQLNTLKIAPDNPAWVIAEAIIPEQVGGWYVREVGLLDTDGTMVAIGKFRKPISHDYLRGPVSKSLYARSWKSPMQMR